MDPFATVPCFSLTDPALDMTPEEISSYRQKRDPAMVKIRDGMIPTRYFLHAILKSSLRGLDVCAGDVSRSQWLFRAGCHRVELPDGRVLAVDKKRMQRMFGAEIAPEEWVDEVGDEVGEDVIDNFAVVIFERSRMTKAERAPF